MPRAETSALAYRALSPSLPHRQQIVLDALRRWPGPPPTGYELYAAMKMQRLAFDLNAVRPRLTELKKLGWVAKDRKRPCGVTGQQAVTWRIAGAAVQQELWQ